MERAETEISITFNWHNTRDIIGIFNHLFLFKVKFFKFYFKENIISTFLEKYTIVLLY